MPTQELIPIPQDERYPGEIYHDDLYDWQAGEQQLAPEINADHLSTNENIEARRAWIAENVDDMRESATFVGLPPIETAQQICEISHRVGGDIIRRNDPTGVTGALIDTLPTKYRRTKVEYSDTVEGGEYYEGTMWLGRQQYDDHGEKLYTYLAEKGFQWRHPADASILHLTRIVSHEEGHALLNGVGALIDRNDKDAAAPVIGKATASAAYLRENPQEGFTGNWQRDVRSHEERFAEGHYQIVMQEVMTAMGYDQDEIGLMMKTFEQDKVDVSGSFGASPVDYIPERPRTSLPRGGKAVQNGEYQSDKHGELGYQNPLTLKAMTKQLQQLSKIVHALQRVDDPDPTTWKDKVHKTKPSRELQKYTKQVWNERLKQLEPYQATKNEQRRINRIVGAVGVVAAAFIGYGLANEDPNAQDDLADHSISSIFNR